MCFDAGVWWDSCNCRGQVEPEVALLTLEGFKCLMDILWTMFICFRKPERIIWNFVSIYLCTCVKCCFCSWKTWTFRRTLCRIRDSVRFSIACRFWFFDVSPFISISSQVAWMSNRNSAMELSQKLLHVQVVSYTEEILIYFRLLLMGFGVWLAWCARSKILSYSLLELPWQRCFGKHFLWCQNPPSVRFSHILLLDGVVCWILP